MITHEMTFEAEIHAGFAHKHLIESNVPPASNAAREIAIQKAIYRLRQALEWLEQNPRKSAGEIADMLEAAE